MIRTWHRYSPPLSGTGAPVEAAQGASEGLVWILEGSTRTLLTGEQARERFRGWRREVVSDQAATDARFGDATVLVDVPSEKKKRHVQGRKAVVEY